MKIITAILSILVTSIMLDAQTVLNFDWDIDAQQKIVITYDLIQEMGSSKHYDVTFYATIDKKNYQPNRENFRGDAGLFIEVGRSKRIIWDIQADHPGLSGNLRIKLKVTASQPMITPIEPKVNLAQSKIDWWGFSSSLSSGIGLLYLGLQAERESKQLYNIYTDNRNPNLSIYNSMSRAEHFSLAKDKRKKGTILTAAGGTAMTVGIAILIKQLQKRKKQRLSINPIFSQVYDHQTDNRRGQAQLSLMYNF